MVVFFWCDRDNCRQDGQLVASIHRELLSKKLQKWYYVLRRWDSGAHGKAQYQLLPAERAGGTGNSRRPMHTSPLQLVETHDTDDDHEVGWQDLPYLVTASYDGDYQVAVELIRADGALNAFNVQPAIPLQTSQSRRVLYVRISSYLSFLRLALPAVTGERTGATLLAEHLRAHGPRIAGGACRSP
ncbi:hypothetical protein BUMB_02472 [Candidatus Paraburkholderia calva]|nr:hypothetical protein BUMB_02472 [Candidatus Paraburkholderia calva]